MVQDIMVRRYKTIPRQFPYKWVSSYGEDRYGIWCTFTIKGVTCKLRWIDPGEFFMGSPEDEPERDSDEIQHKVILTQGYWLGETACTQGLWKAVVGDNPSEFRGSDMLPVDNVSWDDCGEFIETVNKILPGLDLLLPTEAEWENACRAGTKTPFHFGNNITTDQVNYDGNYPYPGGEKGEYRKKTVEVKTFPCNAWGLYEMHGNLLEWCGDWFGEYSGETETDPTGPEEGVYRVLRGGCWLNNAQSVRSASRDRCEPGGRNRGYGFRLAGGQPGHE